MDITLTVTDGTTTVTLSGGLMSYDQSTSSRSNMDEDKVSERMKIRVDGSTIADVRTTIRTLALLFEQARRYNKNHVGNRVYLNYDPGNTGVTWRALLFNGVAVLDIEKAIMMTWDSGFLVIELQIEREPWEGPETELALTNNGGTGTGGRSISNNDYSTDDNWVTIAGSAVAGDMPARCRIELYHSYATNPFQKYIWIHHKTDGLTNFTHVLEAEDGSGGTTTVDANASGGNKKAISWAVTTLTKIWDETLTDSLINSINHGKVSVLIRIDDVSYTDLYIKWVLRNTSGSTLVKDGSLTPIPADRTFVDLGNVRLPPGETGGTNGALLFELWAQRLSAGTHNLNLDYVQLSPIAPANSFRKLSALDGGLKYQETLVDDGIEGRVYRLSSSKRITDFAVEGGPIMLFPGQDQKLIVTAMETAGAYYKAQTFTMRVYYRPRYRVI